MILKPVPGLIVINPDTGRALASSGEEVAPTKYWGRRLADGDVTEATSSPETKQKSTAKQEA